MGNSQSTPQEQESQEIKAFLENSAFIRKYTDIRFGEVKLLQEKVMGTKVLQKDYTSHSVKDYEEYMQICKKRASFNHNSIIKIYGYTTKKEDAFCADFFKVSYFFEYLDYDLEQEIHKRASAKEHFPETEIWYILDSMVSTGAYLQTNQFPIGDIRPFNILITPSFEYKIIDQGIFGKKTLPNYFGLIQGLDSRNFYFSPEIFKNLTKNKKPAYSVYKADVFSLGMSLIEASNLESLEQCYDWDKFTFDENKLKSFLEKVRERYGERLANILSQMTLPTEDNRPDFLTLDSQLSERRAEIRARYIKNDHQAEIFEVVRVQEITTTKAPQSMKKAAASGGDVRKHEVKAQPAQVQQEPADTKVLMDPLLEDLDRRIREAVALTEDTLAKSAQQGSFPLNIEYKEKDPQATFTTSQFIQMPHVVHHVEPQHEIAKSAAPSHQGQHVQEVVEYHQQPQQQQQQQHQVYPPNLQAYMYPPSPTVNYVIDNSLQPSSSYNYEPIRYEPVQELKYDQVMPSSAHEPRYEVVAKKQAAAPSHQTHEIRYEPVNQSQPQQVIQQYEVIAHPPMQILTQTSPLPSASIQTQEVRYEQPVQYHQVVSQPQQPQQLVQEFLYDPSWTSDYHHEKQQPQQPQRAYELTQNPYTIYEQQPRYELIQPQQVHEIRYEQIQSPVQYTGIKAQPSRQPQQLPNETTITLEDQSLKTHEKKASVKMTSVPRTVNVEENQPTSPVNIINNVNPQPQVFVNTQPQTLNVSQPQAYTTQSQVLTTSQPQVTLTTSQPQTYTIIQSQAQPQTLSTSQPQVFLNASSPAHSYNYQPLQSPTQMSYLYQSVQPNTNNNPSSKADEMNFSSPDFAAYLYNSTGSTAHFLANSAQTTGSAGFPPNGEIHMSQSFPKPAANGTEAMYHSFQPNSAENQNDPQYSSHFSFKDSVGILFFPYFLLTSFPFYISKLAHFLLSTTPCKALDPQAASASVLTRATAASAMHSLSKGIEP